MRRTTLPLGQATNYDDAECLKRLEVGTHSRTSAVAYIKEYSQQFPGNYRKYLLIIIITQFLTRHMSVTV